MKTTVLSLLVTIAFAAVSNHSFAQLIGGPVIKFEKDTHDYGDVKKGSDGIYYFEFTNTGTAPLIISDAKGSCGCTIPEFSKDPIAPGAKGKIKVDYDSENRVGPINKSVTVTSNAENEPIKVLKITGNVLPPAEGASPMINTGAPVTQ